MLLSAVLSWHFGTREAAEKTPQFLEPVELSSSADQEAALAPMSYCRPDTKESSTIFADDQDVRLIQFN